MCQFVNFSLTERKAKEYMDSGVETVTFYKGLQIYIKRTRNKKYKTLVRTPYRGVIVKEPGTITALGTFVEPLQTGDIINAGAIHLYTKKQIDDIRCYRDEVNAIISIPVQVNIEDIIYFGNNGFSFSSYKDVTVTKYTILQETWDNLIDNVKKAFENKK
jgi:hypothetical protein